MPVYLSRMWAIKIIGTIFTIQGYNNIICGVSMPMSEWYLQNVIIFR